MKLDATDLRYISSEAFRVLSAVEQGSKNHELVPLGLIAQLSGARSGGVNKALGELSKKKLVGKVQNAKYDGYRLTYGGYDFLACRTFSKRETIYSVGNQIGTGKESDIYVVADEQGAQMVMKIHRLGRVSFRAIKSKRDYLRKGQSASWMYMSRLAAIKEFAFMKVLHEHGFPVPTPIDQSRHCLIMELIDAFPLRQIASVPSPGSLYSALMDLIVRLARSGLIHGDFNEFNILIRDHRSEKEKDRDDENSEEREERILREGGDFPVVVTEEEMTSDRKEKGVLEPVLIDFPQMVSTDHKDAEYYFNRDVTCIRTFFARRFKYESSVYPKFSTIMRDGKREFDLDVEVAASGFSKGERTILDEYMQELAQHDAENESGDEEDEDFSDEEFIGDEEPSEALAAGPTADLPRVESLKLTGEKDKLGNDILVRAEPTETTAQKDPEEEEENEEEELEQDFNAEGNSAEEDDEEQNSEQDEENSGNSSSGETNLTHRRHRPSAKRVAPDVSTIVTSTLRKQKGTTERKHHGKKPVTANVLGRQRGSKMKQDSRRAIKDANTF